MNKEGEPLFLRLSHLLYRSAHARLEAPPTRFEQDVAGGEQGDVSFLGQFYGIRSGAFAPHEDDDLEVQRVCRADHKGIRESVRSIDPLLQRRARRS